jgi:hypothetical protein
MTPTTAYRPVRSFLLASKTVKRVPVGSVGGGGGGCE